MRKIFAGLRQLLTSTGQETELSALAHSTREAFIVHACCVSVTLELWCERLGGASDDDSTWNAFETWFLETLGRPSKTRRASSKAHAITEDTLWLIDFADEMARTSSQRDELPTNLGADARRHLDRYLFRTPPTAS
ncbi:MAG: hypothetical protein IPK13_08530 [Deltaproteobacteria bacterium]|nr:hypothetical protein [Deltaproteobacteria bacterium]